MLLGPLRTVISLAFLAGLIWFSFVVPLGSWTLAEHLDRIGETPEARDLVDGTRETVNPVLQDAADRVLGERVEAPTSLVSADRDADSKPPVVPGPGPTETDAETNAPARPQDNPPVRAIGPAAASSPDGAGLPGRRGSSTAVRDIGSKMSRRD